MNKLNSSFRDPAGFIFTSSQGEILRQINPLGAEEFEQLLSSGLYESLTKKNYLIKHEEVENVNEDAYKTIKPQRLPFISYPYEWSFGQIKDAALLTLFIQKAALKKGMSLKDASAYNVQFIKGKPVFIDTLSFEEYEQGKPWVAYKQFCQHFLAPVALAALTDIRTLQLLKCNIDGIPLDLASTLLPKKTKFKFSLATHIHLHAKTQKKYAGKQTNQKKGKGVSKMAMLGLIDNLISAIKSLKWNPKGTEWGEYYTFTNYSDSSFDVKKDLVSSFIDKANPTSVWDLGANDGTFSSIAAHKGIETVAFDIDPIAVEKNYRGVKHDKICMLPLQLDLTNPSNAIGWGHEERDSLEQRGKADVVMALAIVHHISISNNVPLPKVADYLSRLGKHVIIEFVPKEDSQVKILLATREDIFVDYHIEGFENAFTPYFDIVEKQKVGDSLRTLYLLKSK